jgi:(4S)-4-hydroxy-5-phosphonooxypentane-2,3-dione isomerase
MHIVLVQVTVRAEAIEAFQEALLHNAAQSVAHEPGCLRFDVGQAREDPCRWVLYEVYETAADHERHRRAPHFLAYDAVAAEAVIDKQVTICTGRHVTP